MKKRNVIIDCDPGVDDAVMLALAAAHREELEILGITTVSGDQDIKKVTANALNLAEFYGLSVPVARDVYKRQGWRRYAGGCRWFKGTEGRTWRCF